MERLLLCFLCVIAVILLARKNEPTFSLNGDLKVGVAPLEPIDIKDQITGVQIQITYIYIYFTASANETPTKSLDNISTEKQCRIAALRAAKETPRLVCGIFEIPSDSECPTFVYDKIYMNNFSEIGVYNCYPMNPTTGKYMNPTVQDNWSQCTCLGYTRFPGGPEAFYTFLKKFK